MADQVTFVRRARVVGGFAGSGLLHVGLAGAAKHLIVFLSQSYHAHNEHQMAAVMGHRLDLVVSEPDVRHPEGELSAEAYRSGFTLDWDRVGAFLREVLADIDASG